MLTGRDELAYDQWRMRKRTRRRGNGSMQKGTAEEDGKEGLKLAITWRDRGYQSTLEHQSLAANFAL